MKTQRPDGNPSQSRFVEFLERETNVGAHVLCSEVTVRTAADLESLWRAQEEWLGAAGLATPYWAVVWPGGAAVARYVLDNAALFRDRVVLDFGSGCGICAIAAAKCGARKVYAADIDPYSRLAIAANADLNGVRLEVIDRDVCGEGGWDVVLAGDMWYERFLAERATPWLRSLAAAGTRVLMGDIGRAHFPRADLIEIAAFEVPTPQSLERQPAGVARVWQFRSSVPKAS